MARQRRLMNQINVVPYIDVMLVLLVIFMVTAPMANPGQIELPSVGKSSQAPVAPLEVVIKSDQSLLLRESDPNAQVSERGISMPQLLLVLQHYHDPCDLLIMDMYSVQNYQTQLLLLNWLCQLLATYNLYLMEMQLQNYHLQQ